MRRHVCSHGSPVLVLPETQTRLSSIGLAALIIDAAAADPTREPSVISGHYI